MKATVDEATLDREREYAEECYPSKRNDKRRICVFCGKTIPKGVTYYKHFDFPYEEDQRRWFADKKCYNRICDEIQDRTGRRPFYR